jgi:hypothetical protein
MKSTVKWASYVLVHTPDLVVHNGTTQTTERIVNPDSEYLKEVPKNLRSYDDVIAYLPNQCYIGNITPEELAAVEQPWVDKPSEIKERYGKFGEIMPQDEFYLLVQACDEFELVRLEKGFVEKTKPAFEKSEYITDSIRKRIHEGVELAEIEAMLEKGASGFYMDGKLIGCVKNAHEVDENLHSHIMLENLVSKASSVISLLHAVKDSGIDPGSVDYVIDCSEEAIGDMNQRGGGNLAKASAEIAGLVNATGIDVRGFCAAPVHALTSAAALVQSGAFKTVIVTAGGSTAKLGMNGKDHLKKGLPILEDLVGAFSVILTENDGVNPVIDLEHLGRHRVGTGSSPQAVMSSLVADPLDSAGLKFTDIDVYSPEMQNPDVTKPAGAGDVPHANLKMIGALAVKRGDLERKELNDFVNDKFIPGYAPTQGHIPSGVPYIGHGRDAILEGRHKRIMIIGKGSLFLGRMTNLFDGVSFMILANDGKADAAAIDEGGIRKIVASTLRDFAQSLVEATGE